MIFLNVLAGILRFLGFFHRIILFFFFSFGFARHAEEYHLLVTHSFDYFASKNATNEALDAFCGEFFVLLLCWCNQFSFVEALLHVSILYGSLDFGKRIQISTAALSTSLILLNKSDG